MSEPCALYIHFIISISFKRKKNLFNATLLLSSSFDCSQRVQNWTQRCFLTIKMLRRWKKIQGAVKLQKETFHVKNYKFFGFVLLKKHIIHFSNHWNILNKFQNFSTKFCIEALFFINFWLKLFSLCNSNGFQFNEKETCDAHGKRIFEFISNKWWKIIRFSSRVGKGGVFGWR